MKNTPAIKQYSWRVIGVIILAIGLIMFYPSGNIIYVSPDGDDQNIGTNRHPVQTIQRGVSLSQPGDTIEISPGTYRETVTISGKQPSRKTIRFYAKNTKTDRVRITGAEPSSALSWRPCDDSSCPMVIPSAQHNTFVADVPWSETPTILTETTPDGVEHQLSSARSPNDRKENPAKYHEFWWQATGAGTLPSQLLDTNHLKTSADLTGGRAFIMDGADRCGTYLYVLSIKNHNLSEGHITLDSPIGALTYGNRETGVSQYTKYFVDNTIGLLDTPGEWFYDTSKKKLYLWPLEDKNPNVLHIEIGRRNTGIIVNQSNIILDGITITHINDHDYFDRPTGAIVIAPTNNIYNIRLNNIISAFSGNGIWVKPFDTGSVKHVQIVAAHMENISKSPISFIGSSNGKKSISNIEIRKSLITQSGFPFNEPAIYIARSSNVQVTQNTIRDTASYGIHVTGYEKSNLVSNNITVTDNTVDRACNNASGCAGIKFFGGRFHRTLISRNRIRNTLGWSYCQEKKYGKNGFGMGVFISNASGIKVTNNQSEKNSGAAYLAFTRQLPATDNIFSRNIAADSQSGIALEGAQGDQDTDPRAHATRHDRTSIQHNMLINNVTALMLDPAHPQSLSLNNNIYQNNTYALSIQEKTLTFPSQITTSFPFWENRSFWARLKNIRFR